MKSRHIIVKPLKTKDKEEILKDARAKKMENAKKNSWLFIRKWRLEDNRMSFLKY